MVDGTKVHGPIHSTLEVLVLWCVASHCHGERLDAFYRSVLEGELQFSLYLIDLLSICLKYNGYARIQKAVVDQTGIRPRNSGHDLFFWCKFGSGKYLGASSGCNHCAGGCWLSYKSTFPCTSQSD